MPVDADLLQKLLDLVAFDDPAHARAFLSQLPDTRDVALELARRDPSELVWFALCDAVSLCEPDALTELASRLDDAWPDTLRWAPEAWWQHVRSNTPEPRWTLARALDLSAEHPPLDDSDLHTLLASIDTDHLRVLLLTHNALQLHSPDALRALPTQLSSLELSHNPITPEGLTRLARTPTLPHLKHLALDALDTPPNTLAPFLLSSPFQTLHTLSLAHNTLGPEDTRALGHAPWARHLRHLSLASCELSDDTLAALANDTTHLPNLHTLILSHNDFRGHGLTAFATHAHTPRLTHLHLDGNTLDASAIHALADSEHTASALQLLDLCGCCIGPSGATALAESPHLTALHTLLLRENNLRLEGILALLTSPHLNALDTLDLHKNLLTSDDLHELAPHLTFPTLHTLSLAMNTLRNDGLAAFTRAPALPGLTHLSLAWNEIRSLTPLANAPLNALQELDLSVNLLAHDALTPLLQNPNLTALHTLKLGWNTLEVPAATALAQSPIAATLTHLDLTHNHLSDAGVTALANSPHLRALTHLSLAHNNLEDDAAITLAQSPIATALTHLDLSGNFISDDGVHALANTPNLRNLRELRLSGNRISEDAANTLLSSPHLRARTSLAVAR